MNWLRRIAARIRALFKKEKKTQIVDRFAQAAGAFASMHPHATVRDWIEFSAQLASGSYAEGLELGLRHQLRDPTDPMNQIEDARDASWSWVDLAPDEHQMRRIVDEDPYERLSPVERAIAQDAIGQQMGTHRVVLVPLKDPKKR